MTIALGILATDGVVVAADTQETYPGAIKLGQTKIMGATLSASGGAFIATGAGTAGHLDSLNQGLCETFSRTPPPNLSVWNETIKTTVRDFHLQHIAPYGAWPEFERPGCSLVLAADLGKGRRALWTSEKSAVGICAHCAVGIGAAHANMMLGRLWRRGQDVQLTTLLAAYVVFHVKQYVEGCGKDTQIVVLRDGDGYALEVERVEALENEFRKYMDSEERSLLYVLGRGSDRRLRHVATELETLRDSIVGLPSAALSTTESGRHRSFVPRWVHEDVVDVESEKPKPPRRQSRGSRK
jgi:hypothetical protein